MSIKITWVAPTTRRSGRPLDPNDIANYVLSMRVEGAPAFSEIARPLKSETSFSLDVSDPGLYQFSLSLVDTGGRVGTPATGQIVIPDTSLPNAPAMTIVLE